MLNLQRRATALALPVMIAAAAAGCGGSSSGGSSGSPSTAPSASSGGSSGSSSGSTTPSDTELRAALLTASDVGSNFSTSSDTSSSSSKPTGCPALTAVINASENPPPGTRKVSVTLGADEGSNSTEVDESLLTAPQGQFDSKYNSVADALRSCQHLTVAVDPTTKLDLTLSDIDFGAGTTAKRFDGQLQGTQFTGFLVLSKPRPNVGLSFEYVTTGSGSSQEASAVLQKAQQKADSTLPQ